jgi:CIC family chloride channel protein
MVMVAEMTGGYQLIMPTMLAVAVSYLVQMGLTRNLKYPTLYEAQEPIPADSPANTEMFSEIIADFLRKNRMQLDGRTISQHLTLALADGAGIPLGRGHELLYRVTLDPGTSAAGQQVREIACSDAVIVAVLRGENEIVPGAGTVLQVGDELLIAATPEAMADFQKRIAPLETAGDKAIEAWEESQAAATSP